ncbi:MAG TPA: hypothetical protein PLA68_09070 [Panacibacter sp.]|nr:hypothetical protein [Panacibacter sp.]
MQPQTGSLANVTAIVDDFMFVEINKYALAGNTFEYKICTTDEKIIRKGQFSGLNVQLRLSFIEEGKYNFQLYLNGEQLQESRFEKRSSYYYNLK